MGRTRSVPSVAPSSPRGVASSHSPMSSSERGPWEGAPKPPGDCPQAPVPPIAESQLEVPVPPIAESQLEAVCNGRGSAPAVLSFRSQLSQFRQHLQQQDLLEASQSAGPPNPAPGHLGQASALLLGQLERALAQHTAALQEAVAQHEMEMTQAAERIGQEFGRAIGEALLRGQSTAASDAAGEGAPSASGTAATEKWGGLPAENTVHSHTPDPATVPQRQPVSDPTCAEQRASRRSDTQGSRGTETSRGDYFSKLVVQAQSKKLRTVSRRDTSGAFHRMIERMQTALENLDEGLEEPPRSGCFARLVTSGAFDMAVNVVISAHLIFMILSAEATLQSPQANPDWMYYGDVTFLTIYTVELTMKLLVHRHWFFCNTFWKYNIFDMLLVVLGLIVLSSEQPGLTNNHVALRAARMLRAVRVARIGKVMVVSRHLRSIIVCIEGSIATLFWSLAMLFMVYALFSLFLVDIIAAHIQETGETIEESAFNDLFGSFFQAVLTLFKASTGGDDWDDAHAVIELTGALGSCIYLLFIAFTQFALINIITGIFVDSAMKSLAPDPEMAAQERNILEKEHAEKLEQLCRAVDADASGKLTRDQFHDGMQRKHIPLLMATLGLKKHHVLEFFDYMAESANDGGQVEITTFVNGCMLLRGSATNFDLQKLHADLLKLLPDSARKDIF